MAADSVCACVCACVRARAACVCVCACSCVLVTFVCVRRAFMSDSDVVSILVPAPTSICCCTAWRLQGLIAELVGAMANADNSTVAANATAQRNGSARAAAGAVSVDAEDDSPANHVLSVEVTGADGVAHTVPLHSISVGLAAVSYTHLTLPTIYSV